MTVSTEVDHNDYIGNGVTTSFPYTFRIFKKSDLVVQVVDLNENITELILDTDYTVTGAGGYTGGNVILSTALANGYQISITRELPLTQETDLRNQGKFFAEVHEDAFDKLTMLIQQGTGLARLALRRPTSFSNYYDALNYRISNLKDPVADKDAVNKKWVEDTYTQAVKDAEDAAERAEDAAERAENAVEHGITNLLNVPSVKALLTTAQLTSVSFNVMGYVPGTDFGGGIFYWNPDKPKSQHNGITIFSPTVPWDGSYAGLAAFLAGTGETDSSGSGCWIRSNSVLDDIHTAWAGHDVTGVNDSTASVNACINKFGGVRSIRPSPGTLKISFPTTYQYHDLFSVARKTAFVINGKNNLTIFAENDVNIITDGNGESERVCFGLIGCQNFSITGLMFNQTCTNFSTGSTDTTFKPQEDWFGFICEGSSGYIDDMDVLACRVFCMADTAGAGSVHNKDITLNRIRTDLITNYTFITRFLEGVATLSNSFMKRTGRTWHTYGEDFACADGTWHGKSMNNHFVDPISIQARITPWGVRKSMNIIGDVKSGGGIFIEIGGVTGSIAAQNVTITNCVSEGTVNADGSVSSHILIIGDDLDYSTSFNGINISSNTLKGGGIAINDYRVGLLGRPAYGLVIENNNLDRTDRVLLTSSVWVGTIYRNNKTHIQLNNTGCSIAGKYPTISGNNFDSTFLLAANFGYRIDGATIENNNFSNIMNTPISRIMDWDNFSAMTYRNNRYIGMGSTPIFRGFSDMVTCGWKLADTTAGMSASPAAVYHGKLSQNVGDTVYNAVTTPENFDFCFVAASATTWGKVVMVNA